MRLLNIKTILMIALLVIGLVLAVYLVQRQQIFRSRAAVEPSTAFEIKDTKGQMVNCSSNNCTSGTSEVIIQLKPNGRALLEQD